MDGVEDERDLVDTIPTTINLVAVAFTWDCPNCKEHHSQEGYEFQVKCKHCEGTFYVQGVKV